MDEWVVSGRMKKRIGGIYDCIRRLLLRSNHHGKLRNSALRIIHPIVGHAGTNANIFDFIQKSHHFQGVSARLCFPALAIMNVSNMISSRLLV